MLLIVFTKIGVVFCATDFWLKRWGWRGAQMGVGGVISIVM